MRGSDAQPQANELMAVRKDIWRYKREAEEAKVNLRKVPGRVLGTAEQPQAERRPVFTGIVFSILDTFSAGRKTNPQVVSYSLYTHSVARAASAHNHARW